MATTGYRATLNDGSVLTHEDHPSIAHLPIDKVERIDVQTDKPTCPQLRILADLAKGERVWKFTRHVMHMGSGMEVTGGLDVDVFELKDAEGKSICRLYWHPVEGPILTTKDINF